MYSTTVYLYQQKQQVLLVDTSGAYFQRRWQPVYAKKLKVNLGVDNVILFEFINQDQKPVNISGSTITFRMMSTDGEELLAVKDLDILSAAYGRAKVVLSHELLSSIEAQTASWSLERASGELFEAVFTDAYSSGRGQVDIVDSVYPNYVESAILEVPSPLKQNTPAANNDRNYSSIAYTADNTLTTFQLDFDNFTGNLKAQGSDSQLGPWYDIGSQTVYSNQDTRDYINVDGTHNWVRFEINQYGYSASAVAEVANGRVSNISLNGGGVEWYGTGNPNVDIEGGRGTGATATATVTANAVSSISLVTTGQGYITVPEVKLNSGKITQILYR